MSHRHEKQHSPSPTAASPKQGARKNVGENTLAFRGQTKPLYHPRGQQRGEIKKQAQLLAGFVTLGK